MKGAGAYVRAAREYMKCHIPDLGVPFVATIDFRGFRCLAVAGLPLGPSSGGTVGLLQVRIRRLCATTPVCARDGSS